MRATSHASRGESQRGGRVWLDILSRQKKFIFWVRFGVPFWRKWEKKKINSDDTVEATDGRTNMAPLLCKGGSQPEMELMSKYRTCLQGAGRGWKRWRHTCSSHPLHDCYLKHHEAPGVSWTKLHLCDFWPPFLEPISQRFKDVHKEVILRCVGQRRHVSCVEGF